MDTNKDASGSVRVLEQVPEGLEATISGKWPSVWIS